MKSFSKIVSDVFKRIVKRSSIATNFLSANEPLTSWTHCLSHQFALDGRGEELVKFFSLKKLPFFKADVCPTWEKMIDFIDELRTFMTGQSAEDQILKICTDLSK